MLLIFTTHEYSWPEHGTSLHALDKRLSSVPGMCKLLDPSVNDAIYAWIICSATVPRFVAKLFNWPQDSCMSMLC